MNFLRILTKYYKSNLPNLSNSFNRIRDVVTNKEYISFFVIKKRQKIEFPQHLQPIVNNYFKNFSNLMLFKTFGIRNFASKKGNADCKKLGVKGVKKVAKKKKSDDCGKLPKYACKSIQKSCKGTKKKNKCKKPPEKSKCKKEEKPCDKQMMTIVNPPTCAKAKSAKKDSCKKKEDPCKKKKDPCKKEKENPCKKKKDPCKKKKNDCSASSACDNLPCKPANKKPCRATCSKKDDDCEDLCKRSKKCASTRFIMKNQDVDVVEDLKCEKAYFSDEDYNKDVDEYFENYKNQHYYKTNKFTYYDAVSYTDNCRQS